jgi:TM2 domain-containing membrane protein YozV
MYCRNCGKEVAAAAVMCVSCGVPPMQGRAFCYNCAQPSDPAAVVCVKCGVAFSAAPPTSEAKSKLAAGLLGILLGGLGIHRFYLGYTGIGVAQLILCLSGVLTCGITTLAACIWGLVEGILIFTGSINRDAQGMPLRE